MIKTLGGGRERRRKTRRLLFARTHKRGNPHMYYSARRRRQAYRQCLEWPGRSRRVTVWKCTEANARAKQINNILNGLHPNGSRGQHYGPMARLTEVKAPTPKIGWKKMFEIIKNQSSPYWHGGKGLYSGSYAEAMGLVKVLSSEKYWRTGRNVNMIK